jgi:hypothetical protein
VAIRAAELNRRVQVTATKSWGPTLTESVGREVDSQVAAPLKREHPTGNERQSLNKECGWKDGDRGSPAQTQNPLGGKRKTDLTLTGRLMEGLGIRRQNQYG